MRAHYLKRPRAAADHKSVFKRSRSSKSAPVVGVELDPGHVAAAQVRVNGALTVDRGAVAELRPGIVRDGEVVDGPALSEALRELFAAHELPSAVRLGIAHQRIVARTLDLHPIGDPKELDAAVREAAPDHIPMPMGEAVLDFQHLGPVATPTGPRSRVTIVAVRRETVERLVGVARDAGLHVHGIDLSAFGMVRAVREPACEDAVLYVNVAGLTNLAVANGRGCLFTRAASGGLDGIAQVLMERRGLTLEHARQWMTHVGLAAEVEELEGDPQLVAATRQVLEEGVHQLADTVRNSLNFYRMQDSAEAVERAVLTGPVVAVPGFAERLSTQLSLPVEPAMVEAAGDADRPRLTVAAGLAVEDLA